MNPIEPERASIRVTLVHRGGRPSEAAPPREGGPLSQTPLIDIYETPDGLILEADLPGVRREDVTVQLDQNVLTLVAKLAPLFPDTARPIHEEFPRVDYVRSFILTDDVDREGISAEMTGGVLRLILPKAPRAKPRRIEIKQP
ncbi:MAG: Hsp20/alpha crystallin family protein [Isosphaeraceae bacterium]|nr:Hsp20/alpha crystallin family protein [Isosphaeraceae bacterium]